MKYKYEGTEEFEGVTMESDIPREEWGYGTAITLRKSGEPAEIPQEIDGTPQQIDPQHN